jgi:2-C-methyl-D-erythritol 4-phosphate cytidylyltransferase
MPTFSVLVLTAPPPGQANEASGPTVKVDGREALLRSVELFLNRDNVKQVQLVFDAAHIEDAKRKFGGHLGFSGVKVLSAAGRWADQVAAGAGTVVDEATHVIVHDAARPCVPFSDIDALMAAAEQHDAVALTAPVKATLVELDEGGAGAVATHVPTRFAQLLTPQAYAKATFAEMAKSKKELHPSRLTLVPGSGLNVRVGTGADAGLAKVLLGMLPRPKSKALSNPFEEAQW